MPKHKTKSHPVPNAPKDDGPLYVSVAGEGGNAVLANHAMPNECFVARGSGDNVRVRPGFNRYDRDYYRDEDSSPTTHAEIIRACQGIYRRIGLVRNIIDLMADFASSGLDLTHPTRRHQRFLQRWAKKVALQDRAHDFMKNMLRDGNVIVRRKLGKLSIPARRQMTNAAESDPITIEEVETIRKDKPRLNTRLIPWNYVFISPAICEKTGGPLAAFYGEKQVSMRLSPDLIRAIKRPKTDADKALVSKLPAEVVEAARQGKKMVPLDPTRTVVAHYKKDDWEDWGTSFLFSVLDDIAFKDKMRMADIAALDGVINVIRIWKLGNSDKQILPTKSAVSKLLGILENNVGGGALDVVWDDMIDLQTEVPPVDKILGPAKYQTVNQDIVRGLGIPDSLLGGSESTTRNAQSAFVQLKTLVERLEYVRNKALEWINAELKLVCDAMGIKTLPNVVFGTMNLRDEAAEKALIIQLLDRGIVSIETVHKAFGYDFILELEHMREEQEVRTGGKPVLEKAGPYYRPESLLVKQTDESIRLEKAKSDMAPTAGTGTGGGSNPAGDQPRNDGQNPAGRPANKPSPGPRDQRTPKTMSMVYSCLGASYLDQINAVVNPLYLNRVSVTTMRSLSAEQRSDLENLKWAILCCVRPGDKIAAGSVPQILARTDDATAQSCDRIYRELANGYAQATGHVPETQDRRYLMASAWAAFISEEHSAH
jgi:hypothetical protein